MLATLCTWIIGFYFLGYLIPHTFVAWFFKTKNLKKAYNAEWALVTGSSSGMYLQFALIGNNTMQPAYLHLIFPSSSSSLSPIF